MATLSVAYSAHGAWYAEHRDPGTRTIISGTLGGYRCVRFVDTEPARWSADTATISNRPLLFDAYVSDLAELRGVDTHLDRILDDDKWLDGERAKSPRAYE